MALEGGDFSFAKTPLPPFLERRKNIAPREFIDRVRAEVQKKSDLARIKQDIVLIGHFLSAPPTPGIAGFVIRGIRLSQAFSASTKLLFALRLA
jgi:hypothetical protein